MIEALQKGIGQDSQIIAYPKALVALLEASMKAAFAMGAILSFGLIISGFSSGHYSNSDWIFLPAIGAASLVIGTFAAVPEILISAALISVLSRKRLLGRCSLILLGVTIGTLGGALLIPGAIRLFIIGGALTGFFLKLPEPHLSNPEISKGIALVLLILMVQFFIKLPAKDLTGGRSPAQIATEVNNSKSRYYKEHGITIADKAIYPITLFDRAQVPVPRSNSGRSAFKWVDNDTIVYLKDMPLKRDANGHIAYDGWPLLQVNLNTFSAKSLADTVTYLCFDTETQNIFYIDAHNSNEVDKQVRYGQLGGVLKSFIAHINDASDYYVNPQDCTFYSPKPNLKDKPGVYLRDGDGFLSSEYVAPDRTGPATPGVFVFTTPKGQQKKYKLDDQLMPATVQYDYATKTYWASNEMKEGKLKVWRFNRSLDLVSEDTYAGGNRYTATLVQPGLLVPLQIAAHDEAGKLVRTATGGVEYSVKGLYLMTKDSILELASGIFKNITASPDGCKAVFSTEDQVGMISLCMASK